MDDIDGDGAMDFDDIDGFVAILRSAASQSAEAVPEPSALVLVAIGLIGLVSFSRRRTL